MSTSGPQLDVITIGRSSIDLYSNDIGAPFHQIRSFSAFVGGCPTNIAVACARLGLRAALVTGVGDDPVADFVLHFLRSEKVETGFVVRKKGYRTCAVLLGIQPPDRFPLVFYRERPPDLALDQNDLASVPADRARALAINGTGLSREPAAGATLTAAERARRSGGTVFLDLDFRPDQWAQVRDFGAAIQRALPVTDVVIGTEEEVRAAGGIDASDLVVTDSQMSDARVRGNYERSVEELSGNGSRTLVVKRGAHGARVYRGSSVSEVAPFRVEVLNILGAGDAFAGGYIYGHLKGWDAARSARFGNALGAILVTKPGCANFMPTEVEALKFIESQGGF